MPDWAYLTHRGGHSVNHDCLRFGSKEQDIWNAVLCDGLNGSSAGDAAAENCAAHCFALLEAGYDPIQAAQDTQAAFLRKREPRLHLRKAATTLCALNISATDCTWSNIGDSRLYHFSAGQIAHHSVDDSAAYPDYLNGNIAYEALRLHPLRTQLRAAIGDERQAEPHSEAFILKDGDALLMCSDGFWQYVYETEMCIDLVKAADAQSWLRLMSLRLTARSYLEGDNFTALALFYQKTHYQTETAVSREVKR